MKSPMLNLSEESHHYLSKFLAERASGRSGKLQWDSFLVHAYKSQTHPPAVDLHSYLQEQLSNPDEVEQLLADYQRLGTLFTSWNGLVLTRSPMPAESAIARQKWIEELSKPDTDQEMLKAEMLVHQEPGSYFLKSLNADERVVHLRSPWQDVPVH